MWVFVSLIKCKHGNSKIIDVEFKDKTEQRFFHCYCKIKKILDSQEKE